MLTLHHFRYGLLVIGIFVLGVCPRLSSADITSCKVDEGTAGQCSKEGSYAVCRCVNDKDGRRNSNEYLVCAKYGKAQPEQKQQYVWTWIGNQPPTDIAYYTQCSLDSSAAYKNTTPFDSVAAYCLKACNDKNKGWEQDPIVTSCNVACVK